MVVGPAKSNNFLGSFISYKRKLESQLHFRIGFTLTVTDKETKTKTNIMGIESVLVSISVQCEHFHTIPIFYWYLDRSRVV